jgi:hypothetical protein
MLNKIEINVSGRARLFRFDMYAMELLYNSETPKFAGKLGHVAQMLFAGLSSACNAAGIENDFTREDVLNMLDELATTETGREQINKITECLQASQAFKSLIQANVKPEETESDEEKKSPLVGMASVPLPLEKLA